MRVEDASTVPMAIDGIDIEVRLGSTRKPVRILNRLSIKVPAGCIYGLIGPSGCGKTTLQRCVLGYYSIAHGSLRIFGKSSKEAGSGIPGPNIGYMPQEIALDDDLTVKEILTFFGRLYGMEIDEINQQSTHLMSIMNILEPGKLVSKLSLGQQRRVSLICSLLHRPRLLLLDEPTVGSDPLVVRKIWDYLLELRREAGVTVVLATHYLEEVNKADYFAFMSHGQIMVEDTPGHFKQSQGQTSLEAAILSFYVDRANENLNNSYSTKTKPSLSSQESNAVSSHHFEREQLTGWDAFVLLIWRYLSRWKWFGIYQILGMGLLHFVVLSTIGLLFGHYPQDLSIGVVDEDVSAHKMTSTFIDIFRNNTKNWDFIAFSEEFAVRNAVERGQITGYLLIGGDFSASIRQRVAHGFGPEVDVNLLINGQLILSQDTTNRFTADAIEIIAAKSLLNLTRAVSSNSSNPTAWTEDDVVFRVEPIFGHTDEFEYLASTNIVLVRFYFYFVESITSSIIALWSIKEFNEAMNERLGGAGLKRNQLLMSQVFISTVLFTPLFLFSMLLLIPTVAFQMNGSWTLVVVLIVAHVVCGITKGYMIAWLTNSPVAAIFIQCSYGFSGLFVGNIIWPYESLPYFMRPLRGLFPHTYSGDAAIRSFIYDEELTDPQIYSGLIYATAHAIISLVLILRWFRSWRWSQT